MSRGKTKRFEGPRSFEGQSAAVSATSMDGASTATSANDSSAWDHHRDIQRDHVVPLGTAGIVAGAAVRPQISGKGTTTCKEMKR